MPRKKKADRPTAELLAEAIADLKAAQERVNFYRERLQPLHQQLIAEMAAIGSPLERPDEFLDLGVVRQDSPLFEAEGGNRRQA